MATYYQILGIRTNATAEEITAAYRRLAKIYHPDMPDGNEKYFRELTDAYNHLKDPETRRFYDGYLETIEPDTFTANLNSKSEWTSDKTAPTKPKIEYPLSSKVMLISGIIFYLAGLCAWTYVATTETEYSNQLQDKAGPLGFLFILIGYFTIKKALNPTKEMKDCIGTFRELLYGTIGIAVVWFFLLTIVNKMTGHFSLIEPILHKY